MTCPDDLADWPDDDWPDDEPLFTDDAYDLGPAYPPWWRRPWPVWHDTTPGIPDIITDLANYQPRGDHQ